MSHDCESCEFDCFDTFWCPKERSIKVKVKDCPNCPFYNWVDALSGCTECLLQKEDDKTCKEFYSIGQQSANCPMKTKFIQVELEDANDKST
jgi:hypothetical protein